MVASEHLNPREFETLGDVARAGYVTDEWSRWQKGECGTYACSLIDENPSLRLGSVGFSGEGPGDHFVAHDDRHAYDSAGRHSLPYRGVNQSGKWFGDVGPASDWGLPDDESGPAGPEVNLKAARAHSQRNDTIPGTPMSGSTKFPRFNLQGGR